MKPVLFACLLSAVYLSSMIVPAVSDVEDPDAHLHDSQIPPPYQQPSPEEIKDELKRLFEEADTDKNSLLTIEEITIWMDKVHKEIIRENIDRQWYYYEPTLQLVHSWEGYKPVEKEVLIWDNYFNKTSESENDLAYNENLEDLLKRAKRRWDTADKNNDSVLIKEEFHDFMHPEESNRDEVKDVLVQEAFEDMDKNNDQSISLGEYMDHLTTMANEEEREDPSWAQVQQDHFSTYLDDDKNGALDAAEIKKWLIPSHNRHELEAKRIISETDKNADERLSETEVLDNFNEFFSLIPPEFWSRYMSDETLYQHDEL